MKAIRVRLCLARWPASSNLRKMLMSTRPPDKSDKKLTKLPATTNRSPISGQITRRLAVTENPDDASNRAHFDRNFITALRAMREFVLKPSDLEGLRVTTRRSPIESDPPIKVYWRKDVEAKSRHVWGSEEALEREKARLEEKDGMADVGALYRKFVARQRPKPARFARENWPVRGLRPPSGSETRDLKSHSGHVVLWAIGINSANFVLKGVTWIVTGSHSMFSEMIHSAADTINQIILAYGLQQSTRTANTEHPYGYSQMQHVTSLISAVGIFCIGAGLSVYHGVVGLYAASGQAAVGDYGLAAAVLTGSFASEAFTLALAVRSIRRSAAEADMSFAEYVVGAHDPCVNVVLLEDAAAVLGVATAAAAMGLSMHYGSAVPDAVGSIAIGGLLGAVASFMIYTNSGALVGRSIPEYKVAAINEFLEGDIMVRQIHDVKGIDMGNGVVRYKAEIDVDGRELARYYLTKRNTDDMLKEIKAVQTDQDLELFVLRHGENIVDCLGEQVDRIERDLKRKHPEVRHVDLEVL